MVLCSISSCQKKLKEKDIGRKQAVCLQVYSLACPGDGARARICKRALRLYQRMSKALFFPKSSETATEFVDRFAEYDFLNNLLPHF